MQNNYAVLPEVLSSEDQQLDEDREREMSRLNTRLQQLEDELSRSRNGLGSVGQASGFQITQSTIIISAIVGLTVYLIMSNKREPRRKQPWWERA
jgi:hypothetical protein